MLVKNMPKGIPKNGINKGWFKRKQSQNNYKGYAIYYDKKGYPCIWLNGRDNKVHVLVWEEKHGTKPKGYEIHHKDFDKGNYNIDNLELLNNSDHQRVHAGWIRNEKLWIAKPCNYCKKILPIVAFHERRTLKYKTPGNVCINCSKEKWKKEAKEKEIRPRRFIKPNDKGEYFCITCKKWNSKEYHKFSSKKPQSYCKSCFNKHQKNWRKRKFLS